MLIVVGVFLLPSKVHTEINNDPVQVVMEQVHEEEVLLDYAVPVELLPDAKETQKHEKPRGELATYAVRHGDTLDAIAKRNGVSVSTLMAANAGVSPRRLKIGSQICIPPSNGVLVEVRRGDSLWAICRRHKASLDKALVYNNIQDVKGLRPGDKLFLPDGRPASSSYTKRSVSGLAFAYPVRGRLSSRYGWRQNPMGPTGNRQFHGGIDIAASSETPIRASEAGEVLSAYWAGGLGRAVVLKHKSGYSTVYGHASSLLVKPGQKVQKGETIAKVGRTGRATGPHVHFEIRKNGKRLDPLTLLR